MVFVCNVVAACLVLCQRTAHMLALALASGSSESFHNIVVRARALVSVSVSLRVCEFAATADDGRAHGWLRTQARFVRPPE